ncbi:Nn.00g061240.m01.CDS01 [Neocucurbitaria sp. VM-36]
MSGSGSDSALAIPVKLDAFVFNAAVCDGGKHDSKIAPLAQPNYTFLRLDKSLIQNDVLPHADLHVTTPAECNSRHTDLGTQLPRTNREGVYLHWMVPRAYRIGSAETPAAAEASSPPAPQPQQPGDPPPSVPVTNVDPSAGKFQEAPARWLVIRKINDRASMRPANASIPDVQAWVIESDRRWSLDELGPDVDLQVDVSPFIFAEKKNDEYKADISQQAEIFIGLKQDAGSWPDDQSGVNKPRVSLNLLNSSNHLFADYQPHNGNVFSMLDDFSYVDPIDKAQKRLERADVSYYVLGWHSPVQKSLLAGLKDNRRAALSRLSMALENGSESEQAAWLDLSADADIICHGAMYDVQWSLSDKPKTPGDYFGNFLADNHPVSVGTTPMDALLAYVHVHKDLDVDKEKTPEQGVTTLRELEQRIDAFQRLLQARDDGVEAQREAADLLVSWNFQHEDGGKRFFLSGSNNAAGTKPTKPSDPDIEALMDLNQTQALLDSCLRYKKQVQWTLFSRWWVYNSCDPDVRGSDDVYRVIMAPLTRLANTLKDKVKALQENVQSKTASLSAAKAGVKTSFSQQRDPTLLVGGVTSGWPQDYLEALRVRIESQIMQTSKTSSSSVILDDNIMAKIPSKIRSAAKALLNEFTLLATDRSPASSVVEPQVQPLYHDPVLNYHGIPDPSKPETLWRDRWEGRQPWFPLFLEWEVEYTHVEFSHWSLEERATDKSNPKKLRYCIDNTKPVQDVANKDGKPDTRIVSGRALILPQANISLKSKLDQVFSSTPKSILDETGVDEDQRKDLLKKLDEMAFLSAPLSGFVHHLLTRYQGSHIKPNIRPPGEFTRPIDKATKDSAGLTTEVLKLIDDATDLTPYGASIDTLKEYSPFKPATHGQFRFTKVNIIDKFGQAISAIDPTPYIKGPLPLYIIVSDFLQPQSLADDKYTANTVVLDEPGFCQYAQLPPQINQLSRLNTAFLKLNDTAPFWTPVNEWDNPIWGWVLINYANLGVQLFLPDGTFFREVRFGGPNGTQASPPFLPFNQDNSTLVGQEVKQLQALVEQLKKGTYLQAFVDMITEALQNSPAAPTAYAEFLNSVVSKPFALVNIGMSLELATDEYTNQDVLNPQAPPLKLRTPSEQDSTSPPAGSKAKSNKPSDGKPDDGKLKDSGSDIYEFKVKLGDAERLFDGLICYFDTVTKPNKAPEIELSTIKTFFTKTKDDKSSDPRSLITTDTFPSLSAFWIDPTALDSASYESKRQLEYAKHTFVALINPFTPVHVYSSILPIQPLSLPPWTWQEAFTKMTAFFSIGPLVVPANVPAYDASHKLTSDKKLSDDVLYPKSVVPIPTVDLADWAWLQPYISDTAKKADERTYMALGVGKVDERPRFEPGPYTALEGFLQMRRPIVRPDTR